MLKKCILALSISSLLVFESAAESTDTNKTWSEGHCNHSTGISEGANRNFYNRGMGFSWNQPLGDWLDSNLIEFGNQPFFTFSIEDRDQQQEITIDVTSAVKVWSHKKAPNQGFYLKNVSGGQTKVFSKESSNAKYHPTLTIKTETGLYRLTATADTTLLKSTYLCSGADELLSTKGPLLIQFDLEEFAQEEIIEFAELTLHSDKNQYGTTHYEGYIVSIAEKEYSSASNIGLSNGYVNDYSIGWNDEVYIAEGFEDDNWHQQWQVLGSMENLSLVETNASQNFQPISGKALQVKIPKGSTNALNARYLFSDQIGHDVDEVYLRYYLRLGASWQTNDSGKLPGIAGTYHNTSYEGGWGSRRSRGDNGWSARGLFKIPLKEGNTYANKVPVGTYLYHAGQETSYGDFEVWDGQANTALERNKWYLIEQRVKMNTPGLNDGIIESWIDGIPAFKKTDILFRDINSEHIKIDKVWLNIYHGGKSPINQDSYAYLDNVVVAKSYVGSSTIEKGLLVLGQEENRQPEFTAVFPEESALLVTPSQELQFHVDALDPDKDALIYRWYLNDNLVTAHENSFAYTPTTTDPENNTLKVTVSDSKGAKTTHEWSISIDKGDWIRIIASDDTTLHSRSAYALGQETKLRISPAHNAIFKFHLPLEVSVEDIKSAKLQLTSFAQYGNNQISVFGIDANWVEGGNFNEGASRDFVERKTRTAWQSKMGDFYDASFKPGGSIPFISQTVQDLDAIQLIDLDITQLVKHQFQSNRVNLMIKGSSSGKLDLYSTESASQIHAPMLLIELHE